MKVNPHRSSLGMDANIMALLCYLAAFVLAWIPFIKYVAPLAPLVIFFIEKDSPFVKFHAIQAFILEIINWVIMIIFAIIYAAMWKSVVFSYGYSLGGIGIVTTLSVIIGIVITIFAIIAMVKAYGYFEYKIPLIGNLADKFSK
ncbi:MAG: DUF4870 domain-containing protein, partial [Clostridiales bacterium]|nr:DUF4870 domain-containing protein [Clostridiales bacterium]